MSKMKVRDIARVGDKWSEKAANATGDYDYGVNNPKKDWATETKAAEKNYEDGIKAAMTQKRFGKGVAKAGTQAWKDGATKKGVNRFAEGVAVAKDKYKENFEPYIKVLENTDLPPRYPKGDPRNYERVKAVGVALHNAKLSK